MKIIIQYFEGEDDSDSTLIFKASSFDDAIAELGRLERSIKARDEKNALQESGSDSF